jgi:hypothetical protein
MIEPPQPITSSSGCGERMRTLQKGSFSQTFGGFKISFSREVKRLMNCWILEIIRKHQPSFVK